MRTRTRAHTRAHNHIPHAHLPRHAQQAHALLQGLSIQQLPRNKIAANAGQCERHGAGVQGIEGEGNAWPLRSRKRSAGQLACIAQGQPRTAVTLRAQVFVSVCVRVCVRVCSSVWAHAWTRDGCHVEDAVSVLRGMLLFPGKGGVLFLYKCTSLAARLPKCMPLHATNQA